MDNHIKIAIEEQLEIQVYLETALGRKVTISSASKISSDRNESAYKVSINSKLGSNILSSLALLP